MSTKKRKRTTKEKQIHRIQNLEDFGKYVNNHNEDLVQERERRYSG